MRPSAADLAKLEEDDQRNFQSLMAGQRRPVQGAATPSFPPQPGSGAAFLNPITPQPVQTSEAEFEALLAKYLPPATEHNLTPQTSAEAGASDDPTLGFPSPTAEEIAAMEVAQK
eukprot:6245767-Amphidinium_carterae.1